MKTTFVRPERVIQIVSESERFSARDDDFGWVGDADALSCYRGVWDEGHNVDRAQRFAVIVDTNRKGSCFFWPHDPNMFLPTAKELQAQQAEVREAGRGRRPNWIGVAVAVGAAAVAAYLSIASAQGWWPF